MSRPVGGSSRDRTNETHACPHRPTAPRPPATDVLATRDDLRNVAIVAHVDHGKTTLVDAMLWQSGAFRANANVAERVLDSGDLEREKGITILAKNTAVHHGGLTINIVDTPGHADFGGEVERGLSMVDGVLLLVDASEGPLPQTRFVLRKTLAAGLPVILVINKVDRPDARIAEVVDACYELFIDLDATEEQIEFPIVYASARAGRASLNRPADGEHARFAGPGAAVRDAEGHRPGPRLRARRAAAGARHQPGRQLLPGPHRAVPDPQRHDLPRPAGRLVPPGRLDRAGQDHRAVPDRGAGAGAGRLGRPRGHRRHRRHPGHHDRRDPGRRGRPAPAAADHRGRAGHLDDDRGEHLAAGRAEAGAKVTARLVRDRLDRELVGNVSLAVLPTERPDTWEVRGRGELALAVLVETMRREGYELTVGRPAAVTRDIDGAVFEPVERLSVDVPEEYLGAVTSLISVRRGRMESMTNHGTGWVRLEFVVPARGLIGFRTQFLTETRGTGIAHHVFEGYEPWSGPMRGRATGSLVADRSGSASAYAMFNLQERGSLFVTPGTEVYEGMIVGENSRPDDMDVNITRERKVTNVRQSTGEELERLVPPRLLSLEQALEFCADDECVEVTPPAVRLRKTILDAQGRFRERARAGQRVGSREK